MRRRLWIALAALLVLNASLPTGAVVAQEKTKSAQAIAFATPEQAVDYIATSLRAADSQAILLAFAIERRVADFSFVGMSRRMQSINLAMGTPPARFEFYGDIARAQFTQEALVQARNLAYSLLVPAGTDLERSMSFPSADEAAASAEAFELLLDPARLANLKLVESGVAKPWLVDSEQYRKLVATQIGVTGGDDMQERLVLYELDGRYYRGGITLVHYDEGWHVRSLVSHLGGTSPLGHAAATTLEQFRESMQE